jgi:thiamine pyrophosphate-dependent acetolactate synthase large subunit-like protein
MREVAVVTGAQILVRALELSGVTCVWGLPGTQTLAVWDVLQDPSSRSVTPLFLRNEQNLSLAAKGYFQASSAVSAVVTVPGPGATNLVTGVLDALSDSAGCLLITSDVPDEHRGRGCVHDCDLEAIFAPCVKSQIRVNEAERIADAVFASVEAARSGRPGPAQLMISGQLLRASSAQALPGPADAQRWFGSAQAGPAATEDQIAAVVQLLRRSRRPLIYAGGGVAATGTGALVADLAQRLGAPVVTSLAGRGVVDEAASCSVGVPFFDGVPDLMAKADSAIVLATRFSEFSTATWAFDLPPDTVRVDIDPAALQLNYPASIAIRADVGTFLKQLLGAGVGDRGDGPGWGGEIDRVHRVQAEALAELKSSWVPGTRVHPIDVVAAVRSCLPDDAIVTMDGSATEMWFMHQAFPVHQERTFLCSEVFQELGAALPLAMGARAGRGDGPVVCLTGDGGLMYYLGELGALVQQSMDVKIVVFDDGGWYNSIRQFQDAFYGGRVIGTLLGNPDFAAIAGAFGLPCQQVSDSSQLAAALSRALGTKGPAMVVVEIDPTPVAPRFQVRIHERTKTL